MFHQSVIEMMPAVGIIGLPVSVFRVVGKVVEDPGNSLPVVSPGRFGGDLAGLRQTDGEFLHCVRPAAEIEGSDDAVHIEEAHSAVVDVVQDIDHAALVFAERRQRPYPDGKALVFVGEGIVQQPQPAGGLPGEAVVIFVRPGQEHVLRYGKDRLQRK